MVENLLSVSDAARELGCRPRDISDLFYARVLDDEQCPILSRRRVIPRNYLPEIKAAVEKHVRGRREARSS